MLAHLYNTEDLTAPPHSTYEDESTTQDTKKEKRQAETCSRKVRKGN